MDPIEKLLRKVNKKDREQLLAILLKLQQGEMNGLKLLKLKGSDLYRVRVGRFRILFLLDTKTKVVEVRSVRLRSEDTYK